MGVPAHLCAALGPCLQTAQPRVFLQGMMGWLQLLSLKKVAFHVRKISKVVSVTGEMDRNPQLTV